jgi:hypothetical protein
VHAPFQMLQFTTKIIIEAEHYSHQDVFKATVDTMGPTRMLPSNFAITPIK